MDFESQPIKVAGTSIVPQINNFLSIALNKRPSYTFAPRLSCKRCKGFDTNFSSATFASIMREIEEIVTPRTIGPVLDWEEMEMGVPGQLPLPEFEEKPYRAERVFIRIARMWSDAFETMGKDRSPTRSQDLLSFSCIYLAQKYGEKFTTVAMKQAKHKLEISGNHPRWREEQLPWHLVIHYVDPQIYDEGIETLYKNLNHHFSPIRLWMMDVAWQVRPRLDRDKVLPILLQNVTDTLGGVTMAWGLAGALFANPDEFYEYATHWEPARSHGHDFLDQYRSRMRSLKEAGLFSTQESFWRTQVEYLQVIEDVAMSI